MNVGSAIKRFERRSKTLVWQAWALLVNALILMAFGGVVVYSASSLTARDIGAQDFDKRLEQAQAELTQLGNNQTTIQEAIRTETLKCSQAYAQLFSRWPVDQSLKPEGGWHAIDFRVDQLPDADEIAHQLTLELRKPDISKLDVIGFQLNFGNCGQPIFLLLPKGRFGEVTAALIGQNLAFDRKQLVADEKRTSQLFDAIQFQQSVLHTIYTAKVQAVAAGNTAGAPAQTGESNDLLLRLIQTSITRFGVLAVIGFLVSILVSLYRYNIRLAAFYTARADVLRLCGAQTSVTDFVLMAAALSPQLEFGKTPQPPILQLADLIKSLKDTKG